MAENLFADAEAEEPLRSAFNLAPSSLPPPNSSKGADPAVALSTPHHPNSEASPSKSTTSPYTHFHAAASQSSVDINLGSDIDEDELEASMGGDLEDEEPLEGLGHSEGADATSGNEGLQDFLRRAKEALFPGEQPISPPEWGVWSRILEDIWHVMHRVMKTIPNGHSLRKQFSTAFSKTLFTIDEDDKERVIQALSKRPPSTKTTWDELRKTNPDWLWRRVRRYVPEKEYLATVLDELFQSWGHALCSRTGLPLFNKVTWKKAEGILESVRRGWVSDPPGISLYVKIRTDVEGLPVYRCLRGTNSVEGGVHMVLMRIFGSLNASVELADSAVADWRHRHNTDVCCIPPDCVYVYSTHRFHAGWMA